MMIKLLGASAVAVVLAFGAGRLMGYNAGHAASEAAQEVARQATQKQLFQLGEELSRKATEIEAMDRERTARQKEFEDAARDAPGADRPGIGSDGVRRLQQRWGAP